MVTKENNRQETKSNGRNNCTTQKAPHLKPTCTSATNKVAPAWKYSTKAGTPQIGGNYGSTAHNPKNKCVLSTLLFLRYVNVFIAAVHAAFFCASLLVVTKRSETTGGRRWLEGSGHRPWDRCPHPSPTCQGGKDSRRRGR